MSERPYLTIIRGLPGSGKSTRARKYAADSGALLVEPDMFVTRHGEYCYTEADFKKAVKYAKDALVLAARMEADVIYADVLPTRQDVKDVILCYRCFCGCTGGPIVNVIDMSCDTQTSLARNRHGVRREDIEAMAAAWEPWGTFVDMED